VVVRVEYDDGSKECPVKGVDGSWGKPKTIHPVFDESRLSKNQIVIVVEGEKKVEFLNAMAEEYQGLPIVGFTVGSSQALRTYSPDIAVRLQQLQPSAVLLWPDNDDPGLAAMRSVRAALNQAGLPCHVIEPSRYGLGPHEDVVDHIMKGDSTARVVSDYLPSAKVSSNGQSGKQRVDQLVAETVMLSPTQFLFPATQNETRLENVQLQALWMDRFGGMPPAAMLNELKVNLTQKGQLHAVRKAYQCYAVSNTFWWRPTPKDPIYQVSAEGTVQVDRVPQVVLLNSCLEPKYTSRVEIGTDADFQEFCNYFNLSKPEQAMVLTWLVSAFTGRKSPILLFKGNAATGKTTLASALCAVVDPDTPTVAVEGADRDKREFLRVVQSHPVLLIDNVSSMPASFEDFLSKIVTGETASIRTLYEDTVQSVRFQRAVAITTTTWDVSKGDLATRIWPVEPKLKGDFFDEDDMEAMANHFLPRLRGYVFEKCKTFYARSGEIREDSSLLRVGGRIVAALGFKDAELNRYIRDARAKVLIEADPWLDYLVQLWGEVQKAGPYKWSATDIAGYVEQKTGEKVSPRTMGHYIRQKEAHFRDYGFQVQRTRVRAGTEYKFEEA
jgi:hypothetical protein